MIWSRGTTDRDDKIYQVTITAYNGKDIEDIVFGTAYEGRWRLMTPSEMMEYDMPLGNVLFSVF